MVGWVVVAQWSLIKEVRSVCPIDVLMKDETIHKDMMIDSMHVMQNYCTLVKKIYKNAALFLVEIMSL